jgi:hypothetical protein
MECARQAPILGKERGDPDDNLGGKEAAIHLSHAPGLVILVVLSEGLEPQRERERISVSLFFATHAAPAWLASAYAILPASTSAILPKCPLSCKAVCTHLSEPSAAPVRALSKPLPPVPGTCTEGRG